jgi:hypothetical protein
VGIGLTDFIDSVMNVRVSVPSTHGCKKKLETISDYLTPRETLALFRSKERRLISAKKTMLNET